MAGEAGRCAHDATRMPLMEHLRELRSRLIKAALAIVLGGVGGFVLRDRLINVLQRPVCSIRGVEGIGRSTPQCRNGVLTLTGPTAGISLAFDIAIFGASFVLPLILVLFNALGILSAARMRHWWRGFVLAIFVFSAVAVPTGDPVGMSVLAIPICLLYFAAIAVSTLNDRRRARRRAADPSAQLRPDQACALDLSPAPVEPAAHLDHVP